MIDLVPKSGMIKIGKQGENRAIRVILPNIRAGAGSILLLHQRALDKKPYPVPVSETAEGIIWVVSSTDTANQGRGQAELQWLGENGEIVKSVIYQTETSRSLSTPGAVPDEPMKPYVQAVAKDAQAAKNAAASAAEATKSAKDSAGQAGQAAQSAQMAKTAAEEAVQGVAADREQIGANTAGLEAARQDVAALTAENTALKFETARTARSLDYLWKKSKGIIYDTETITGAGSSVTVPSGAMEYAALRKIGGMSRNGYQVLTDDFPESSTQISVTKSGRYSYVIETLNDGIYRQSAKTRPVSGAAGQYTLHARIVGQGGLIVRFYRADGSQITQVEISINYAVQTVNVSDSFANIQIVLLGNTGTSVPIGTRTEISKIMLESGNTAHPWEPYADNLLDAPVDEVRVSNAVGDITHTYPIPQTIRDMCPDYGQGTINAYNYIDITAKTYHHAGSMSQNGTWTALATPEIIDVSAVWPDDFGILQVEAGGTIGLHYPALDDGYELAVPSETEIMVDVAKVVGTDG